MNSLKSSYPEPEGVVIEHVGPRPGDTKKMGINNFWKFSAINEHIITASFILTNKVYRVQAEAWEKTLGVYCGDTDRPKDYKERKKYLKQLVVKHYDDTLPFRITNWNCDALGILATWDGLTRRFKQYE